MHSKKLIVILGPTASGKTSLSIELAKAFNGEIVSADSRQIYKGLDIGSGKVTKEEMKQVPHYGLDVIDPKERFSVSQFQKLATEKILEIQKRGKVPFLVGGTGFYIQSIVEGVILPEVSPNLLLREKLEQKTTEELFSILKKLDPARANTIDKHNPRRLVRAIEVSTETKKPIPPLKPNGQFEVLQIGIKKSPDELKKAISERLLKRLENEAMTTEVRKLHEQGLSWERLEELGLEYRFVAQYIQNKLTRPIMVEKLQKEIEHFAKRQMTWFSAHGGSASGGKRQTIHWIVNKNEARGLIENFLK